MPRSRNPKRKRGHSAFGRTLANIPYGEATIEAMFDRAKFARRRRQREVLLYHYTTMEAAESIIASQRFRATAHDCTNDDAELASADATIIEALSAAEERSSGLTTKILRAFRDSYESTRIGASARTYLVCFSQTRDDSRQWRRYGAEGYGVCLGLRLFEIPEPRVPELSTQFMPVQYDPAEWRSKIDGYLDAFIAGFERAGAIRQPESIEQIARDTLTVATTAWALTSKQPRWQRENEIRMIVLVRENMLVQPESTVRADGTCKRFLTVPVTSMKRMPVEEFLVGPNVDFAEGSQRAAKMLARAGYRNPESRVVQSSAVLPCG